MKKEKKQLSILGTRVDFGWEINEVIAKVDDYLSQKADCTKLLPRYICTTNPEFVLEAQKDRVFKEIINNSWFSLPDGFGLILGEKFISNTVKYNLFYSGVKTFFRVFLTNEDDYNVLSGVDLSHALFALAEKNNYSLFLLGGWPKNVWGKNKKANYDLAQKATTEIKKKYPKINIIGATSMFSPNKEQDAKTLEFIHECMSKKEINCLDIILVAYGQNKQEKWLIRNLSEIKVKLGVGVGGTFDFISGDVKRAPKTFVQFHMEWLYRLFMQPWRIKRIFMAVVVFPIKIFIETFKNSCRHVLKEYN